MGIFIMGVIIIIQIVTIVYAFKDTGYESNPYPAILWGIVTTILLLSLSVSYANYTNAVGKYKTIEAKIELVDENTQALTEEVKAIVLQYPEVEKELVKDLKPDSVLLLGQTYPNLKSNESYNKVADLIIQRLIERENLQKEKIDLQASLYSYSQWWWFAKEWERIK